MTVLTHPRTSAGELRTLLDALDAASPVPAAAPEPIVETAGVITLVDHSGHRHLPGVKTSLGPVAAAALSTTIDRHHDASSVMFSALLGAARARWHFDDVATLLESAPGLEHARTARAGDRRRPRPSSAAHAVLSRQWDRAVTIAASTRHIATSHDSALTERAELIGGIVTAAQQRADSAQGRWSTAAGTDRLNVTDRVVLDELHRIATQAMTPAVEAPIRTLAKQLAVGRESVRQALHRLARDGWIAQVASPTGPHGSTWTIDPEGVLHRLFTQTRSQGEPAPTRRALLQLLDARREAHAHDVFTSRGLGVTAGYVYARALALPGATASEVASHTGLPPETVTAAIGVLTDNGLWPPATGRADKRDLAAVRLGAAGTLDERRALYELEQSVWAYWQSEISYLRTPVALRHLPVRLVALPGGTTVNLAAFPRLPGGRGDWEQARESVQALVAS